MKLQKPYIRKFIQRISHLSAEVNDRLAAVVAGYLRAGQLRMTAIARRMWGKGEAAGRKMLQRLLARLSVEDLEAMLRRLVPADVPMVIGDITEVERPWSRKTPWVGRIRDKTRGYRVLMLGFPWRGRVVPFFVLRFSSQTLQQQGRSRNMEHMQAVDRLRQVLAGRPLVLDREFSYTEFLQYLTAADVPYVIRLNTRAHIQDAQGRRQTLLVARGETKVWRNVWYRGEVAVHVAGTWLPDASEPLFVITSIDPWHAIRIYLKRMTIEESFRDLKNLLHIDDNMSRSERIADLLLWIALLAYALVVLVGECVRDHVLARWERPRYSGVFVLLRRPDRTRGLAFLQALRHAWHMFCRLVDELTHFSCFVDEKIPP